MNIKAYVAMSILGAMFGAASAARAQAPDDAVVYIECKSQDGKDTIPGTGVLVSAQGHVLTARHVAPQGYECTGVIGNASKSRRELTRDPRQAYVDATLLRFTRSSDETFNWLRLCHLDDTLRGREVVVTGFPQSSTPSSKTGELSTRPGSLSTTQPDGKGIVQTTALSATGMSGGPVTLKGSANVLGIVAGADFDPATGAPSAYGVLAVESFLSTFGVTFTVAKTCESDTDRESNSTGPDVDKFFKEERIISRLIQFGDSEQSVKSRVAATIRDFDDPEISAAVEFDHPIPTSYWEVPWNPPRTNKSRLPECMANGKIVFFFRDQALFRVSLRSWYSPSPNCTTYDGYFNYASEGVAARIEETKFKNTNVSLGKMFTARGKKVVMAGWRDRRIAVVDIAGSGNDDFMSEDWIRFVADRLQNPW